MRYELRESKTYPDNKWIVACHRSKIMSMYRRENDRWVPCKQDRWHDKSVFTAHIVLKKSLNINSFIKKNFADLI